MKPFKLSEGWSPAARTAADKVPALGTRYVAKISALTLSRGGLVSDNVAGAVSQSVMRKLPTNVAAPSIPRFDLLMAGAPQPDVSEGGPY